MKENKLKLKDKKDMELLFNSEIDFKLFIFHIRRIFYQLEKKHLVLTNMWTALGVERFESFFNILE